MKKKLDIDWSMIYIPITAVVAISIIFMIYPASSKEYLKNIRMFLSNNFESYYIVIALAFVICTLYLAFSKYGKIKLGKESTTPEYSNIKWGMMIFTSTMSADIIFYSLCEWIMYSQESYMNHIPGGLQKWGLTYSLFHWGPMAWEEWEGGSKSRRPTSSMDRPSDAVGRSCAPGWFMESRSGQVRAES